MIRKRRDKKNRLLYIGESQRKDGRYVFKYQDTNGKSRYVYSRRLVPTDPIPQGTKPTPSLREMEPVIQRDLRDKINHDGGKIRVLELVKQYIALKTNVRESTKKNYQMVVKILEQNELGSKFITQVHYSDAKLWMIALYNEGRSYSTVQNIKNVLRPAFQIAVDDDYIRKNVFDFSLSGLIKNNTKKRNALSEKDEQRLLDFIRQDSKYSKYYDAIYILLNTGLRISEFTGLTIRDIDFDNMQINVSCQLLRQPSNRYSVEPTKTKSGVRLVPMTSSVADSFHRIIQQRKKPRIEPMISGHSGYLFLDKKDMPFVAIHWEHILHNICEDYDAQHECPLPHITPHVCRHTFCTRMAMLGMNPKILQYIMGHSSVEVTLNLYTHASCDEAHKEMGRILNIEKEINHG